MKAIGIYVIKVEAIGQEGIRRWICHLQLIRHFLGGKNDLRKNGGKMGAQRKDVRVFGFVSPSNSILNDKKKEFSTSWACFVCDSNW